MVIVSRKVDYAILALFHLMRHPEGDSARGVASKYRLSRPFIANILKTLCQHGFVESQRGSGGGYRLSLSPSEISIRDIIAALDGPFQLVNCALDEDGSACDLLDVCPVQNPLRSIHEQMLAFLERVTLDQLESNSRPLVDLQLEKDSNAYASHIPG